VETNPKHNASQRDAELFGLDLVVESNSPSCAPRDDTARASYRNGAKSVFVLIHGLDLLFNKAGINTLRGFV
jgi:hypothetical protein